MAKDVIIRRIMTANHLPKEWRMGLDGQELIEVYENVSELRRIKERRDVDNETGFVTDSTGETG